MVHKTCTRHKSSGNHYSCYKVCCDNKCDMCMYIYISTYLLLPLQHQKAFAHSRHVNTSYLASEHAYMSVNVTYVKCFLRLNKPACEDHFLGFTSANQAWQTLCAPSPALLDSPSALSPIFCPNSQCQSIESRNQLAESGQVGGFAYSKGWSLCR